MQALAFEILTPTLGVPAALQARLAQLQGQLSEIAAVARPDPRAMALLESERAS